MCDDTKKKSHAARFDPNQQLGKKFKTGVLWALHNILIHPLMSVADCLHGITKLFVVGSEWLHDKSAPGPLDPPVESTEEDEATLRHLHDEAEAMENLRAKPDPEEEPDAGDLPDEK